MINNYETRLKKIAMNLTYEDYVRLVLFLFNFFECRKIVDIKYINNKLAIWFYYDYWEHPGELSLYLISNDEDEDDSCNLYNYDDNHTVWDLTRWSFSRISSRIYLLEYFCLISTNDMNPYMLQLENKIEELKILHEERLSFLEKADECDDLVYLDARILIDRYKYYLKSKQIKIFWSLYTYSNNIVINNIESIKGLNMEWEQSVLVFYIKSQCKQGYKCTIQGWRELLNSSEFKVLTDGIHDLKYTDMVAMEFYETEHLDAGILLNKYKHYLRKNQINKFWSNYKYPKKLSIDNIDFLRGMNMEQKVLCSIIETLCKQGFKCLIKLWYMDSGFEILSDRISDLVNNGMVNIVLYRWNDNSERTRIVFDDINM